MNRNLIVLVAACGLISPGPALVLSPVPHTTFCRGQAGIVLHRGNTEELHLFLKAEFNPYRSSLWIIPLPAEPVVGEFRLGLFEEMSRLTAPVRHGVTRSSGGCGLVTTGWSEPQDDYDLDQTELYASEVGQILSATVVRSDQIDTIAQWVRDHRYIWSPTYAPVIEHYIKKGWTNFVMAQTDSGRTSEAYGISLSFPADDPAVPVMMLKADVFSSDNYDQKFPVYVAIIAREKKTGGGFQLSYANRVDAEEQQEINRVLPGIGVEISENDFVTKLVSRFGESADVAGDLELVAAPDNKEFRSIINDEIYDYYQAGNGLCWLLLGLPVYFGYRWVRRRRCPGRGK